MRYRITNTASGHTFLCYRGPRVQYLHGDNFLGYVFELMECHACLYTLINATAMLTAWPTCPHPSLTGHCGSTLINIFFATSCLMSEEDMTCQVMKHNANRHELGLRHATVPLTQQKLSLSHQMWNRLMTYKLDPSADFFGKMWLDFEKCGSICSYPYFFGWISADTFTADFPAELNF